MPLDTAIVGATTQSLTHAVDARWLMAYAAALEDYNPRYLDTQATSVVAHPLFPVCVEWPVILETRAMAGMESLTQQEAARGVHAAHDLHLFAPIGDGDELNTIATMIEARQIRPGAAYTLRLDTHNQTGQLVARTYQLGIYRDVEMTGADQVSEAPPALPAWQDPSSQTAHRIAVSAGAAHTYTECARIWNPIHTDRAVALAAGLPDLILHGTATLALAITHIVNTYASGDPSRVHRLGGRFSAMVLMPSTIAITARLDDDVVSFVVKNEAGEDAISGGFVCLGDPR